CVPADPEVSGPSDLSRELDLRAGHRALPGGQPETRGREEQARPLGRGLPEPRAQAGLLGGPSEGPHVGLAERGDVQAAGQLAVVGGAHGAARRVLCRARARGPVCPRERAWGRALAGPGAGRGGTVASGAMDRPNYIAFAVPFFFAGIGIELVAA